MNRLLDPVDLAIRKISETRRLLALVVNSSESFDYPKAKAALCELELKLRELARVQARLQEITTGGREGVIALKFSKADAE